MTLVPTVLQTPSSPLYRRRRRLSSAVSLLKPDRPGTPPVQTVLTPTAPLLASTVPQQQQSRRSTHGTQRSRALSTQYGAIFPQTIGQPAASFSFVSTANGGMDNNIINNIKPNVNYKTPGFDPTYPSIYATTLQCTCTISPDTYATVSLTTPQNTLEPFQGIAQPRAPSAMSATYAPPCPLHSSRRYSMSAQQLSSSGMSRRSRHKIGSYWRSFELYTDLPEVTRNGSMVRRRLAMAESCGKIKGY